MQKPNIHRQERELQKAEYKMSFKLGLNRVQEALVMGLMIILVFVLFSNVDLLYKIGIGVMVFTLIVLASLAAQVLNQAKERKQF